MLCLQLPQGVACLFAGVVANRRLGAGWHFCFSLWACVNSSSRHGLDLVLFVALLLPVSLLSPVAPTYHTSYHMVWHTKHTSHACMQADLVLSRLASSCRQADPHLLSELRGELLYMARVIEEPVSDACGCVVWCVAVLLW